MALVYRSFVLEVGDSENVEKAVGTELSRLEKKHGALVSYNIKENERRRIGIKRGWGAVYKTQVIGDAVFRKERK